MSKNSIEAREWSFVGERMEIRPITIRMVFGPFYTGARFAVRRGGNCLSVDGEWEYEPIPSDRDDAFYAQYRFPDFESAYQAAVRAREAQ